MTFRNPFDLTGKVAVVTGANSGLGLAFAEGIASAGGDVVVWGRRAEQNALAVDQLKQYGNRVTSMSVDVRKDDEVADAVTSAVTEMGRVDCLVANAGISTPVPSVLELSSRQYHELLDVNLHGSFYALREAARHMVDRAKAGDPGGSLIVNGSTSAFTGVPGIAHYAAAKGALLAMLRGLAVELGPFGVRANMVAPGYTVTSLNRTPEQAAQRAATDARFITRTPLGRNGVPEDMAGAVVYLMSDASSFHTGDALLIDGGASVNLM